ncbi:MAG: acyl-CoA dehydrogenase family protein [Spirochaetia bacterium]
MSNGILQSLYTDSSLQIEVDKLAPGKISEEARTLVRKYNDTVKTYPPQDLEKNHRLPKTLMDSFKSMGLFGLSIPKEYGGLGLSLIDYFYVVSVMAEKDMALAIVPLAHLSIGMKGILLFGNREQKKKYLTKAASGEMVFAYALTEPKKGSDAKHIETVARKSEDGTHYVLNGTKTYITNGGYAGGLTVFAQIEGKENTMGAFIVETDLDGVSIGKDLPKMGLTVSSTTAVMLKDVKVPAENLIGEEGDGFKIAMTILNYGRLGLGAASAGAIRQSVEDMKNRANSREQFGEKISSFELIQEKIGYAAMREQSVWAMTAFTASLLEKEPLANVAIESSHTKLYGTENAWHVLYDALQVAGGAGYLRTQPYEKRMRDFRVTTVFEGTSEIHTMYPPLSAMRAISSELNGKNAIGKLFRLLRLYFPGTSLSWLKDLSDPPGRAALGEAKKNIALARKLIAKGMGKYGKHISEHQFYLRKITKLSYTAYAIMSVLFLREHPEGWDSKKCGTDIVLRYLIFDAKEARRIARSKLVEKFEDSKTTMFQCI